MTMFAPDKLKSIVEAAFPQSTVEVRDLVGDNDHFELVVVSSSFEGKGLVDRHRMVYSALGGAVGNEIHALSLKTMTPNEAGRKK